jgi:hypothetical protein
MIKLVIPGQTPPSWNKLYSMGHWGLRKKIADEWHELIALSAIEQKCKRIVTSPGHSLMIDIVCYFKNRRLAVDPDNICAKVIIDGLKENIIEDDNMKYIKRVSTSSWVDSENPRTEIEIY